MEILVEKTSNLGRSIKVTIPAAAYQIKIKEKIKHFNNTVSLKGFRIGSPAHASVIATKFGPQVRSEVLNEVVTSSFYDAIKQENLSPVAQPKFKEIKGDLKKNENLEYIAEFDIFPQVDLADFNLITLEKEVITVLDSDVDAMILRLQEQYGIWDNVSRAAQNGDSLSVDYKRTMQTENSFTEEQAQTLTLGSKGILQELNDGLMGKSVNDVVTINVHYPETWRDSKVAGKKATLEVTINSISSNTPAELDKLVDMFGIEGGIEVLKQQLRERMDAEAKQKVFIGMKESVLEQLIKHNPVELPLSAITAEKDAERSHMLRSNQARATNIPALTQEQEDDLDERSKSKVLLGILLHEIIAKYSLVADPKAIRAEINRVAVMYPNPVDVVNYYYSNEKLLSQIESAVLLDKAVELIISKANVTEKEKAFDEIMQIET